MFYVTSVYCETKEEGKKEGYLELKGALLTAVGAWWDVAGFRDANVTDIQGFRVGELILHACISARAKVKVQVSI